MQAKGEEQYGDETDAIIRQRSSRDRFRAAQPMIYNNIKLIRGLQSPTTDKEKALVEKCRGQVVQDEREAKFSGELQSSFFLFRGTEVCKYVGKIRLTNGMHGTGFMISKRLLLTCHHVFHLKDKHCTEGFVKFGTIEAFAGFKRPLKEAEFKLEPETFYYHSEELDIAIIAVAKKADDPPNYPLSKVGFCSHVQKSEVLPGQHVNIIQFPGSDEPQKMILRQNQVVLLDGHYVKFVEVDFVRSHDLVTLWDEVDGDDVAPHQYETFIHVGDTLPGSSGAGCFDDEWRLIGIHHSALHVSHTNQDAKSKKYVANEGTAILSILSHIEQNITEADPPPKGYNPRKLGKPFEKTSHANCCSIF